MGDVINANNKNNKGSQINCAKCKYFYVTWDPNFPRGCRMFGFKTKTMPSFTVLEAIGKPCTGYTIKKGAQ